MRIYAAFVAIAFAGCGDETPAYQETVRSDLVAQVNNIESSYSDLTDFEKDFLTREKDELIAEMDAKRLKRASECLKRVYSQPLDVEDVEEAELNDLLFEMRRKYCINDEKILAMQAEFRSLSRELKYRYKLAIRAYLDQYVRKWD